MAVREGKNGALSAFADGWAPLTNASPAIETINDAD